MPKSIDTTKTFVLDAHPTIGDLIDPPDGYDCFVVEIDPEYAIYLLRLIRFVQALHRRFKNVYKLELWDRSGAYHAADDEDAPDKVPGNLTILGDIPLVPAGNPSRTECERLMVTEDAVHWAAYPKHCDVELETEELPLAEIQKIAGAAGPPTVPRVPRRSSKKRP